MDDLVIPCILWFPGDPPPDLSGFAEPICFPVRVVWRKQDYLEQESASNVSTSGKVGDVQNSKEGASDRLLSQIRPHDTRPALSESVDASDGAVPVVLSDGYIVSVRRRPLAA